MCHWTVHTEQIQAVGPGTQGLEEAGQKHVCGIEPGEETPPKEAAGKVSANQTQIQEKLVKLFLSHILYYMGDFISRTIMRAGIGYPLYNRVMLWSSDLDTEGKLWKPVKKKRSKKR